VARVSDDDPEIMVRVWNTGESLHRGDEKCPLPSDLPPDELTVAKALDLLERGSAEHDLGTGCEPRHQRL